MASRIAGTKGSTSRPKGKPDPAGAMRRHRVMQLLMMQGVLAVMLVMLAVLMRGTPRSSILLLWTLLVPAGFAYTYGTAFARHEKARKEGTWSKEWDKRETTRGYSLLAGVFGLWIVGALAIFALL